MSTSLTHPHSGNDQNERATTEIDADKVGIESNVKPKHDGEAGAAPAGTPSNAPQAWSINTPFDFAPPKPDGDPWVLLLEPLLKEDERRCDTWRDEVQNLLIFAGLFSAVVTSFIVQSYQGLQGDPNATMITLLSHIAARLDAPLAPGSNMTASPSQPASISMPPFSPTPSSILVNVLWFTSLVLSLMMVLIGTISLQWLHEHQTYSNCTPRQMYALYHMRDKSLTRWHVDKFFSAMPLLLQSALAFFLIGISVFLWAAGQWAVTAPILVLIALTLLFLFGTTVLPSVQVLALSNFLNGPHGWNSSWFQCKRDYYYSQAPTPCPYKSPQSHAIFMFVRPLFILFHRLSALVRYSLQWTRVFTRTAKRAISQMWARSHFHSSHLVEEGTQGILHGGNDDRHYESPSLSDYYFEYYDTLLDDWVQSDLRMLVKRDKFMRNAFGRLEYVFGVEDIGFREDSIPPLVDTVYGLNAQIDGKATASAAYACFVDISQETLRCLRSRDPLPYHVSPKFRFYSSSYLHDLVKADGTSGLADVLRMENSDVVDNLETLRMLLHHQNLDEFLRGHCLRTQDIGLFKHRTELILRLLGYFYTSRIVLGTDVGTSRALETLEFLQYLKFVLLEPILVESEFERDQINLIAFRTADIMLSMFRIIDTAPKATSSDNLSGSVLLDPLMQRTVIFNFINEMGCITAECIHLTTSSSSGEGPSGIFDDYIISKFDDIFTFLIHSLQRELETRTSTEGGVPSLLFYMASLYAYFTLLKNGDCWERNGKLKEMVAIICRYKQQTIDRGVTDRDLEERLARGEAGTLNWQGPHQLFSELWWDHFESVGTSQDDIAARHSTCEDYWAWYFAGHGPSNPSSIFTEE